MKISGSPVSSLAKIIFPMASPGCLEESGAVGETVAMDAGAAQDISRLAISMTRTEVVIWRSICIPLSQRQQNCFLGQPQPGPAAGTARPDGARGRPGPGSRLSVASRRRHRGARVAGKRAPFLREAVPSAQQVLNQPTPRRRPHRRIPSGPPTWSCRSRLCRAVRPGRWSPPGPIGGSQHRRANGRSTACR